MCLTIKAWYIDGYPLNLSILVNGGKEIKRDSLSSCERRETNPPLNPFFKGNCSDVNVLITVKINTCLNARDDNAKKGYSPV